MEDVARYVERIIVMNRGRIMLDGTPGEVFAHGSELEESGLAIPQVTQVVNALYAAGLDVRRDVTTVDEAVRALVESFVAR